MLDALPAETGAQLMQRALHELRELRAKVATYEAVRHEPIAIVGIGCRFPGGADSPGAFWDLLQNGRDAIRTVPENRWDVSDYYDADPAVPGKMYSQEGGFLDDVSGFDAKFFQISAREAAWMDPQQRLALEVSWEALERAGVSPSSLFGSNTGVFLGISSFNYVTRLLGSLELDQLDPFYGTGNALSVAAGRLSYLLGLQGPSMAIDTACSSSLVAVQLACESLRRRECDLVLAGGVGLILTPETTVNFCRAGMLARDSRCKTFDASADGYVRGEGCGMVALKRLSDAKADGHEIIAVIRGAAVNHNGRSTGLTVPNGPAQQAVIRAALKNGNVPANDVGYVEAHGTGTALGDPIEIEALSGVFAENRPVDSPLYIGSVKTNIGHLEAAAGIAGLIKAALTLQKRCIPPSLHFQEPNFRIDWKSSGIRVADRAGDWPANARFAGVSSFGFGGANAHVVLEQAPTAEPVLSALERPMHILTLSAPSESGLQRLVERYIEFGLSNDSAEFANQCFTGNVGRSHFTHRVAVVARNGAEAVNALSSSMQTRNTTGHNAAKVNPLLGCAFLFEDTPVDSPLQYPELYRTLVPFRRSIDQCDDAIGRCAGDTNNGAVRERLASFSTLYALANVWRAWGVQPLAVFGSGLAEPVAACVAGMLNLDEAVLATASLRWECGSSKTSPIPLLRANERKTAVSLGVSEFIRLTAGQATWTCLLERLSELYVSGAEIDWAAFDLGYSRKRVNMPTYPFERERHWIDVPQRKCASHASVSLPESKGQDVLRKLGASAAAERHTVLLSYVQKQVAEVLGFSNGELPPLETGFFDMGMDSVVAVELRNRLQSDLERPLASTATFEYPSVLGLSRFLEAELFGRNGHYDNSAGGLVALNQFTFSSVDSCDTDQIASELAGLESILESR